jgi:hypothetical protein
MRRGGYQGDYDNRAMYREIHETYVSPVLSMPLNEIKDWVNAQRKAHFKSTESLLAGDTLSPEQFTSDIKLDIDAQAAKERLGRDI